MLEDQPCDQVGSYSTASPMTKMQGRSACRAVVRGLPCIFVIGEAALAADLITWLIFKHLERNLAAQKPKIVRKGRPDPGLGLGTGLGPLSFLTIFGLRAAKFRSRCQLPPKSVFGIVATQAAKLLILTSNEI